MTGRSPHRHRRDVAVPAECRESIAHRALVAISTSGGKDSQAMMILLSRIVPRDHLFAVHAPLGESPWVFPGNNRDGRFTSGGLDKA